MYKTNKLLIPVSASKPKAQKASIPEKTALQDLFRQGHSAIAEQSARDMIRRYPHERFGWTVLGAILQQQGKLVDALEAMAWAAKISPEDAEAWCNLGNAQRLVGQIKAAENSFRTAISLRPNDFVALNNLGGLLRDQRRFVEAEKLIRRALTIKPDYANAYINLGALLKDVGRLTEAEKAIRKALEYLPHNVSAWFTLSIIYKDLHQFDQAITAVRRALEIQPDFSTGWTYLSVFQRELGDDTDSDDALRKAIDLEPERAAFRLLHAIGALPITPATEAAAQSAGPEFARRVSELRQWLNGKPARREEFSHEVGIVQPFYLAYRPGNHRELLSQYGDLLTQRFTPAAAVSEQPKSARSKIRLLIITGHIRRHSVWDILLKGIVRHLDRTKFELFFYHLGKRGDEETVWARTQANGWRDLSTVQGHEDWLAAIRQDQADIIYYPEIGMNKTTVFLAAHRLAPLQVVGWGHPITSGLATMDCFLSGELIEGPDAASHYREALVLLPGTGCCTEVIDIAPEASSALMATLAAMPRPRFVIPQRHFKFDPVDDGLFAEIAARVGECSFLFFESNRAGWALQRVLERISKTFRSKGLDPDRYLKAIPWLGRGKFYTLLDACDVFLDCPSFSGYTTAWQAAHRGLPIVTLEGETMRQRLAAGLLRQIGQTDTIAHERQGYVDIAVRLAEERRDSARYTQRRRTLQAAVASANHRIEVVRAFEASLIQQLAARQAPAEDFVSNTAKN